ncbi:MAG TPA: hypothetical protein DCQ06_13065, partial [Myxococcales bacterium]|nr:hypothetical protein [Myxococcales bacterium]
MNRLLRVLWLLLCVGCADLNGSDPQTGSTGQGDIVIVADTTAPAPDTQAAVDTAPDPAKSCAGKCGAKYDPSLPCQCNDQCGKFGNCCQDFGPLCAPETFTCEGRCGVYDKNASCQCNDDCPRYGQCCPDYLATCHTGFNFDYNLADADEFKICDKPSGLANIEYAKDGDTIELIDGSIVRLLLVNTPELTTQDCYAIDALNWMKTIVKTHKTVCLVPDPSQPNKDQYGRLLRYVYYKEPAVDGQWVNLNLRLVRL